MGVREGAEKGIGEGAGVAQRVGKGVARGVGEAVTLGLVFPYTRYRFRLLGKKNGGSERHTTDHETLFFQDIV